MPHNFISFRPVEAVLARTIKPLHDAGRRAFEIRRGRNKQLHEAWSAFGDVSVPFAPGQSGIEAFPSVSRPVAISASAVAALIAAAGILAVPLHAWPDLRDFEPFSLAWRMSGSIGPLVLAFILIALIYQLRAKNNRLIAANALLTTLASQDGLTGLFNRRHLDEFIGIEWRRSSRERQPLSVLMIDIDFFKNFNDRYGHAAGDKCLRSVAAVLGEVARRPGDLAARYGGEEFVLVLPSTDARGAIEVTRRLQDAVRKLGIKHDASPLGSVTVSVGIATQIAQPDLVVEDLMSEADRFLYYAKKSGRNRAVWADDRSQSTYGVLEVERSS